VITLDIVDLNHFKQMIIASGRSVRHIRKMTESIVHAVRWITMKQTSLVFCY
jgi:ribosomal silencing factor RsfS